MPTIDTSSLAATSAATPHSNIREFLTAAALQQIEMVRYFIEIEGMHPDATWDGKPTAICYAALQRNTELLRYLAERGAAINHADAMGQTPLMYATLAGWEYGVAMLIALGADLDRCNCRGETALALAHRCARGRACRELLFRHGAAPEAGRSGRRCFH